MVYAGGLVDQASLTPSVAGLVVVGLLLLALALLVPGFVQHRKTISNLSESCELSREAHVVTTKTPGHGGPVIEPRSLGQPKVVLRAGCVPGCRPDKTPANPQLKEPTMPKLFGGNRSKQVKAASIAKPSHPVGVGNPAARAAYLKLRAARAHKRLILTLVLLAFTADLWGARLIPTFWYPWWYGVIPTALLLAVLIAGRMAARAAHANDLRYSSAQRTSQRRNSSSRLSGSNGLSGSSQPVFASVVMDDADAEVYQQFEEIAVPIYDEPVFVNDQVRLPVPATQLIPEADQRLAVLNNLKDDPEVETSWSLGTPQVPVARSRRRKAERFEVAC